MLVFSIKWAKGQKYTVLYLPFNLVKLNVQKNPSLPPGRRGRETVCHVPSFFEIVVFSEILMFRRKILGLLLLLKIKVSKFIGKSLNLPPSYSTDATTPLPSSDGYIYT